MALFIRTTRREPRRFSYDPRYYDPKKDEDLRRRMRIKSHSRARRRSPAGIIYLLLLLGIAVYIYTSIG